MLTISRNTHYFMCALLFLTGLVPFLVADSTPDPVYPEISSLRRGDIAYRQLQDEIETNYQKEPKSLLSSLMIFSYTLKEGEDYFAIAGRLNPIPDTIASLNHISRPENVKPGDTILVPSISGLFLCSIPKNDLEALSLGRRDLYSAEKMTIVNVNGEKETFFFFPMENFHPIERSFFLGIFFQVPIDRFQISSSFGPRKSPFSTRIIHHQGIDIPAPAGSEVKAAREGTVTALGYDTIFGNYVEIDHKWGGYATFYGHLQDVQIQLHQTVTSGMIIGTVGSTGLSTGSHLHFEIRKNSESINPENHFKEGE